MDISRLKKVLAGVSLAAVTLTQVGTVIAAYSDVPAGVWYEEAVDAFTDAGYLDASQPRFRGGDKANRAEFVKLVVELNGGILSTPPAVPSFNDVATSAWYYGYMEEAGKEGWVRGDNNCYGNHPATPARPRTSTAPRPPLSLSAHSDLRRPVTLPNSSITRRVSGTRTSFRRPRTAASFRVTMQQDACAPRIT